MKTLLSKSILFLFILFTQQLTSQAYIPIPATNSSSWNTTSSQTNQNGVNYYKYNYFSENDTLISGKEYTKIKVNRDVDFGGGFINFSTSYIFLHNDTTNKQVFNWNPTGTDHLLYDFNLTIGDTIKTSIAHYTGPSSSNRIVDSIDQVLINGKNHKRFFLNPIGTGAPLDWLIEGVGCSGELINGLSSFEYQGDFICYSENNTVAHGDINCHYTVSVNEAKNQLIGVKLFPNPANNIIQIVFNEHFENAKATIIDLTGKTQKLVNTLNYNNTLNISNLKSGTYLLKIETEKGNTLKRFVKMN